MEGLLVRIKYQVSRIFQANPDFSSRAPRWSMDRIASAELGNACPFPSRLLYYRISNENLCRHKRSCQQCAPRRWGDTPLSRHLSYRCVDLAVLPAARCESLSRRVVRHLRYARHRVAEDISWVKGLEEFRVINSHVSNLEQSFFRLKAHSCSFTKPLQHSLLIKQL